MSTYLDIEDLYAKIIPFVAEAPAEDSDEDCLDEEGNEPLFEVLRFERATLADTIALATHLRTWAEANSLSIGVTRDDRYVYIQR